MILKISKGDTTMTNEQAIQIFNNRANSRTVKFSEETKRTYLTYINSFFNSEFGLFSS